MRLCIARSLIHLFPTASSSVPTASSFVPPLQASSVRAPSGRPSDPLLPLPFAHPAPAARSVPGDDGAAGGARSQRRRHEARPHVVGPRVVRVGTVIGVGIFVLTGREAKEDIGLAVVISYVVSSASSMLSVSRCVRVAGGS
ncbi:hypothetical protein BDA96_01G257600 [Sorghum bicolor]|uniref:Amino acid permease/ SLC12A domain-containing protein n=1 Tax=Sorghum bicolor TaxID=4558 RepID=A0A921RZV6_SORBI|nr:hypothetical protein BDA96_01G257600 [Sorghum bicolor]